jgi:hypothetical protein
MSRADARIEPASNGQSRMYEPRNLDRLLERSIAG